MTYIEEFFNHYNLPASSLAEIATSRKIFKETKKFNVCFSQTTKSHYYSNSVFNVKIVDIFKNQKPISSWFETIDEMLEYVDNYHPTDNRQVFIAMPKNANYHNLLLKNNQLRKELKPALGFYPEVHLGEFAKYMIMLPVTADLQDEEKLKQVCFILNNHEEPMASSIYELYHGNKNYRISPSHKIYSLYNIMFSDVKNLDIILTTLKFAGIKLHTNAITIHTNLELIKYAE